MERKERKERKEPKIFRRISGRASIKWDIYDNYRYTPIAGWFMMENPITMNDDWG